MDELGELCTMAAEKGGGGRLRWLNWVNFAPWLQRRGETEMDELGELCTMAAEKGEREQTEMDELGELCTMTAEKGGERLRWMNWVNFAP